MNGGIMELSLEIPVELDSGAVVLGVGGGTRDPRHRASGRVRAAAVHLCCRDQAAWQLATRRMVEHLTTAAAIALGR